jgi:hypothetical protein
MGGRGKSNLLAWLLYQMRLRGVRWILFDASVVHRWQAPEGCQIVHPVKYRALETFLDVCRKLTQIGNIIFAVEEVEEFVTPQQMPPEFEEVINRGRSRYHISYWATSRRPAEVHGSIIANCDHHFIFQNFQPRDVEYYKRYVGEVAEQAKNLPRFQFLYYHVGSEAVTMLPVKKVI